VTYSPGKSQRASWGTLAARRCRTFGNRPRYAPTAPSEPKNIPSRVDVAVEYKTAVGTGMHPNRERLRNDTPTSRTDPACVSGIHRDDLDPGLNSLVVEQFAEHPQAGIVRRLRKRSVLKHKAEGQILQDNRSVGGHKPSRDLVPEIPALIGDVLLEACNFEDGPLSIAAAAFLPGNRTLQTPERGKRPLQRTRVVEDCPIGKHQSVGDPDIYAHKGVEAVRGNVLLHLDLEANVPAGRLANDDDVFELPFRDLPVPVHAHASDILQVESPALERRPIAGLESHAVEVVEAPEARSAALAFHKLPIGTVEAAENLLAGAHVQEPQGVVRRVLVTPVPPHAGLLVVPDASATLVPPLAPVGQGMVVEGTRSE